MKKKRSLEKSPSHLLPSYLVREQETIKQKISVETYGERMKNTKNTSERKRNILLFAIVKQEMISTGEKCVRKTELPY